MATSTLSHFFQRPLSLTENGREKPTVLIVALLFLQETEQNQTRDVASQCHNKVS